MEGQPLLGKKILYAEDHDHLRTLVAMMITELGAEVITAENGESALELYKSEPDIDLVLMDIKMRGLGGTNAFKKLLEFDPDVKVVLSSGVLPGDELKELLREKGGGFIEKPFNLDRLGEVLSKVLAGEPAV